jgi:type II secretory pathway component PulL
MKRDPQSMPVNELWSLQELADADREESSESLASKLRAQQQRTERLDRYFNQTVAEIRASLERSESRSS